MDYQKWLIGMTWNAEYATWVCSRNAGKSFLVSIFAQARSILYPKSKIHIMSSGSRQANETFETLEAIAKHNVKTLISDNTVFWDEIMKSKADSDGFTHDPKKGNNCKLLNASFIQAVTGSAKTVRGKRSNVNIYDEAGTIPRDFYDATEPFVTQSAEFKMGSTYDPEVYPQEVPNLRLYVGSASDTNSLFWEKYREGLKQMLMGNDKYFVADLNCEIPLHPTANGNPVKPLLSKEEIERKRRENEIACNREYYNIFDRFDLEDSVVTRTDIIQNEEVFIPAITWGGKKHKYVITYDPASRVDNSPVLVTDLFKDEDGIIKGRFVHMENLVKTYGDGSKVPMTIEEQVQRLREMIYEYNGRDNTMPYENVMVLIDFGMAGQAPALAQELCKDWTDAHGRKHPGLYDETSDVMKRWAEAFPHAIPGHLRMLEPAKYRNQFFEATKKLVASGDIKFPPRCPKGEVLVLDDGTERKLGRTELASLIQMDLMKEEMACMMRFKTNKGTVSYGLPPEKARKMHDDRNFVAIMACWWVNCLQQDEVLGEDTGVDFRAVFAGQKKEVGSDWASLIRSGNGGRGKGHQVSPFKGKSPFNGGNPFQ